MIDFDANGIHVDANGYRIFKRMVRFDLNGSECVGGIYIGQSTEAELLIERFDFVSTFTDFVGDSHVLATANVWKPSGEIMTIPVTKDIWVWDPNRTE